MAAFYWYIIFLKHANLHFRVCFVWLLFFYADGSTHLCDPFLGNTNNTASFCRNSSADGDVIFITSEAPTYTKINSCICIFTITGGARSIYVSYKVASEEDCGIEIKIDSSPNKFTCASQNMSVSSLMSVEFSRSIEKNIDLCLKVSLGNDAYSNISVTCETDTNDIAGTPTKPEENEETDSNDTANTPTKPEDKETTTHTTWTHEPFANTEKSSGSKKENSALIGGIVGGSLIFFIIIIIVVVFIWLRKRKNEQPSRGGSPNELNPNLGGIDKSIPESKIDDGTVVTYNVAYNIEM